MRADEAEVDRGCSSTGVSRRIFLAGGLASVLGGRAFAADPVGSAESVSPAQALERLAQGNKRYVSGGTTPRDFTLERQKLTGGQQPIVAVLACSDSRVVPEFIFDMGLGELFVVRVAGNASNDDGVASLEYAVRYLGVSAVLVLGHSACGAIKSAIAVLDEGVQLPGKLPELIEELKPAVQRAREMPGNILDNAIRANVAGEVDHLRSLDAVIAPRVAEKKLIVTGGVYDLATGRVDMLT